MAIYCASGRSLLRTATAKPRCEELRGLFQQLGKVKWLLKKPEPQLFDPLTHIEVARGHDNRDIGFQRHLCRLQPVAADEHIIRDDKIAPDAPQKVLRRPELCNENTSRFKAIDIIILYVLSVDPEYYS